MAFAIAALAISCATGWFAFELVCPRERAANIDPVLRCSVGSGLGLLISSLIYLLCLLVGFVSWPAVVGLDALVLLTLGFLAHRRRKSGAKDEAPTAEAAPFPSPVLAGAVVLAALINGAAWLAQFRAEPLGFWDAFALWNMKARFFFFEAGAQWQNAFSPIIDWSHTDYPLLLPLNVARLWVYTGEADSAVSAVLSALFTVLAVGAVYGSIASIRDRSLALVAVLALFATPALMNQAVWQVADIPLAFYLTTALGLAAVALSREQIHGSLLVVAGLAAGTAAWTKNEGLLLAIAIPIALAGVGIIRAGREGIAPAVHFAKGLALPLAVLFAMKLVGGGENDLAADFSTDSATRLFDLARHGLIVESFGHSLLALAGVPLLIALFAMACWLGVAKREDRPRYAAMPLITLALVIGLQLSGYYFVYVITERDLAWHLGTSNLRLFVQLWPSVLLLLFASVGSLPTKGQDQSQAG